MYLNAVSFVIPYKKIIVFFANFFHSLVTLLCQCPVFMAAAMCDPTTTERLCAEQSFFTSKSGHETF